MNKKEYLDYIIPKVEDYFLPFGFKYQKSKAAFIKTKNAGWVKLKFGFLCRCR